MRRRGVLPLVLVGCLLALPAQASAQSKIFQDYRKNGSINPCNYSPSELKKGLSGLPPDVEAYVPGLSDSLRRGCGVSGGAQPTQAQRAAVGPVAPGTSPPTPPGAASGGRRTVVPRPPAPKLGVRDAVAGTAPKVPDGPLPDSPAWLAALLAAA